MHSWIQLCCYPICLGTWECGLWRYSPRLTPSVDKRVARLSPDVCSVSGPFAWEFPGCCSFGVS